MERSGWFRAIHGRRMSSGFDHDTKAAQLLHREFSDRRTFLLIKLETDWSNEYKLLLRRYERGNLHGSQFTYLTGNGRLEKIK